MNRNDDRDPRLEFRVPEPMKEWVEQQAEKGGISVSEVLRRSVHFMQEAQGAPDLAREGEIRDEIDDIIEENQELRKVVPSKWRSHVRGLFRDDIRDDPTPDDLKILAGGYRRQAEKYEELAETIPEAPAADLVEIVDEELRYAMDAADLSTYYEGVENPHEKHLDGVEEGMEARRDAVALVQGLVQTQQSLAAAFNNPEQAPPIKESDLPQGAGRMLPEDLTEADAVRLANRLVEAGVRAEDVPDAIPTTNPEFGVRDIEQDDDDPDGEQDGEQDDPDPATIRRGGEAINTDDVDAGDDPLTVSASDDTQQRLSRLPAADGGRHPDSVPGTESVEPDDTETMTRETDTNDDSRTDAENDEEIADEWERLEAAAVAQEGGE